MLRHLLEILLSIAPAAPAAASGKVWVVDPAGMPGSDFLELQQGIDAAAPGDVVLVRGGTFDRLVLDGKGITIAADAGALVQVESCIATVPSVVADIPVGEVAVLRGLRFRTSYCTLWEGPPALEVHACAGAVWIEDCVIEGHGPEALRVDGASLAVLQRCAATGTAGVFGGDGAWLPGNGLTSRASIVCAQDSSLTGGAGLDAWVLGGIIPSPHPGADGCALDGGVLVAAGCALRGGDGGDGLDVPYVPGTCLPPEEGGNGAQLGAHDPLLYVAGTSAAGGAGGTAPCSPPAANGAGYAVDTGAVVRLPGAPARLTTSSPVREGQVFVATIVADAARHDVAFIAHGPAVGAQLVPSLGGMLLLAAPFAVQPLSVPPDGVVTLSVAIGDLGPGVESLQLLLQSATCAAGTCTLGGASHVLLLDAAL